MMDWVVDHVFFATAAPAEIERELEAIGFAFTKRRRHAGQGTENACAVFENAFFELLWSVDAREIRSAAVRPLGLEERVRWRETGACPIGVCLRPVTGGADSWPLETWHYAPPYVAGARAIPVITPKWRYAEPLVFIAREPASRSGAAPHGGERRSLAGVSVGRPVDSGAMSESVKWCLDNAVFSLTEASDHLLRLEFDHRDGVETHRLVSAPIEIAW